ncbi:Protein transport protein Sec61 subunit gamma-1 [Hibiscus syriacus]|uniref:Protein transport protein Sec61 subunit gamma-1 n=1 Tax=Hibiscus syriacus TaxID=106335 RepID=A0A6A2YA04_HIBSY|nr:Protein transport protein Sec61 subunit gamma-1 [Hibiscus syriacus]
MDTFDNVVDPLRDFTKDSVCLVKRCHKLVRKDTDDEQHSSKQNQRTMYGSLDKLSMLDLRAYLEKQGRIRWLSVTLGHAAATGLGLLAFSEVENVLQLVGSAAIIQLLSKKLLFAEDLWWASPASGFLIAVEKCWQDLCDQMLMIRGIALLGEAVDRTLLNHLLKMFTALGIYSESFEKPFLECTS